MLRPQRKYGSYDTMVPIVAVSLFFLPLLAYLDLLLCLVVLQDNLDFWQVSVKAKGLECSDDMFGGNSLFSFLFTDFVGLRGKKVDEL